MRRAVLAVVVLVFVLVAVFMVRPWSWLGGGSAASGSLVSLGRVVWRGCDNSTGVCFIVFDDGSGAVTKDGRVVATLSLYSVREALTYGGGICAHHVKGFKSVCIGLDSPTRLRIVLVSFQRNYIFSFIKVEPQHILSKLEEIRRAMLLHSLDGTIHSLGGDVITAQLWSRMRDYNVSDPAIEPYIEWLRNALAPDPSKALNVPWYPRYTYYGFNDGDYYYVKLWDAITAMDTGEWAWAHRGPGTVLCRGSRIWDTGEALGLKGLVCFIPPFNDSIVRIGLVKLPFGAGLIVTA